MSQVPGFLGLLTLPCPAEEVVRLHSHSPEHLASLFICQLTMADLDNVTYNIAAFIAALFVLEFGADKFIDHTAIVARRTGIPDTIIGLVTAGGEWEEVRL